MLITYGQVEKLKGKPWAILELRSDHTLENTLRRMCAQLPGIFRESPFECFVPVESRDLDTFALNTKELIYARGDVKLLWRLRLVTGVIAVISTGEVTRTQATIWIEDSFVQSEIAKARHGFEARSAGIHMDSFVRLIDGQLRDMCGHVVSMEKGSAHVLIELKSRCILVQTPVRNLLNLDHVPVTKRVWYYCKYVDDIDPKLVTQDLKFSDFEQLPEPEIAKSEPNAHRKTLVSARVRALMKSGMQAVQIRDTIVEEVKANKFSRLPVDCASLRSTICGELNGKLGHKHGDFSDIKIHEMLPDLPLKNPNPKKDGRSAANRLKWKKKKCVKSGNSSRSRA